MNYCAIQRNGVASREEMKGIISVPTTTEPHQALVCPKPRRVGFTDRSFVDPCRLLRLHLGHQVELSDVRAGSELIDIILPKGGHVVERSDANYAQVASSPPFLCGSPPSRVANSLIRDTQFKEGKILAVASPTVPTITNVRVGSESPPTSSSSARKGGGCVRASFGNNPVVRIEGFDCLDRERHRNSSVPALA